MAASDIYAQTREARTADRALDRTRTANPNATPGAGRGSRNGSQPSPGWAPADPSTGMPAQSPLTPGLNNLPTTNPHATEQSNRSGAFGKGAQNLQARRDLYEEMANSGGNFDQFKDRAAALGVTPGGWQNAVNRLSMGGNPSAAPAASQANQKQLAATDPTPETPPAVPLPNQSKVTTTIPWSIAKPNPYSVAPTTGSMTPDQAIASTRDAINIGKKPAAPATAATPASPSAPTPEVPPTAPLPGQSAVQPAAPMPTWADATGAKPADPSKIQDKNPATFSAAPRGSTPEDFVSWAKELAAEDMKKANERKKRIQAKKDSVTIPSWQEGTWVGNINRGLQRYAANWTP